MKEKAKILLGVLLVIGGVAVIFSAVLFFCLSYVPQTDQYSNYEIIDANLTWIETGRTIGKYTAQENGGEVIYKYKKIKGEDEDKFIGAWRSPDDLFADGTNVLMVSDNLDIDIWNDWTIKKIELFYVDSHQNSDDWIFGEHEPAEIKKNIIVQTNDGEILDEFEEIISNISEYSKPDKGYSEETPAPRGEEKNVLYCGLRVYFEESENIIWETRIDIHSSSSDKKIFFRRLSINNEIYNVTEIPNDCKLYNFLIINLYP